MIDDARILSFFQHRNFRHKLVAIYLWEAFVGMTSSAPPVGGAPGTLESQLADLTCLSWLRPNSQRFSLSQRSTWDSVESHVAIDLALLYRKLKAMNVVDNISKFTVGPRGLIKSAMCSFGYQVLDKGPSKHCEGSPCVMRFTYAPALCIRSANKVPSSFCTNGRSPVTDSGSWTKLSPPHISAMSGGAHLPRCAPPLSAASRCHVVSLAMTMMEGNASSVKQPVPLQPRIPAAASSAFISKPATLSPGSAACISISSGCRATDLAVDTWVPKLWGLHSAVGSGLVGGSSLSADCRTSRSIVCAAADQGGDGRPQQDADDAKIVMYDVKAKKCSDWAALPLAAGAAGAEAVQNRDRLASRPEDQHHDGGADAAAGAGQNAIEAAQHDLTRTCGAKQPFQHGFAGQISSFSSFQRFCAASPLGVSHKVRRVLSATQSRQGLIS